MCSKKLLVFLLAVVISAVAAGFRWGDSGHAIGLIKRKGGEARHPIVVAGGKGLYSLIVTATVIPPYSGDARLVLEGEPEFDYEIFFNEPVIDLGLRRRPEFREPVLQGLKPRDRVAIWVVIRPAAPAKGKYRLAFYDTRSGNAVLSVPIIFEEEGGEDGEHH